MFCVTNEQGDEIVVVEIRPNLWEATHHSGYREVFRAKGVADASSVAKELIPFTEYEDDFDTSWSPRDEE